MRSSNATFDEDGFGNVIRDIEELNLNMSDLGEDAEGQSGNLSVLQGSVSGLSTNVQSLANRQTADEAAIAALQSSVAGISTYKTSSDICILSNASSVACSNTGTAVAVVADTKSGGMSSSYSVSTGMFTAPSTGLYQISASIQITGAAAWTNYMAMFSWNETTSANIALSSTPGASFGILSCTGVVSLSAGNQARLYVQTPNAGATTYQIFAAQITRL